MTPPVRITISGEHPVVGAAARQPSGVRRPDETGRPGRALQSRGASDTGGMNAVRRFGGPGRDAHPHGGGGALREVLRLPEETFPAVPLAPNCFFVSAPLRHYALDVGDTVGAGWDAQGRLRVTDVYCLQPGWYVRGYIRGFEREQERGERAAERGLGEGAAGQGSARGQAMVQTVGSAATELCFLKRTAQRLATMNDGVFVGQWSPKYSQHQLIDMFDVLQPRVTIAAMLCPAERLRWLRDWVAGRPLAADPWGSGRAPVAADPARYQAGRDPEWFARGLATPEFLRHIQTLVRDNADLLTLIEAGEYDRAVRWIRAYDAALARLAG
ncbi:MAG: hypothetical protein ACFNVT_09955 [Corynebacterium matruchotii]|uniref:hypothetical protein n=1 Tax=Corynebacterium matruchotii TaxID=43768 RepID=UPI0036106606